MSKAGKMQGEVPKPEDYHGLLNTIDILVERFEQAEQHTSPLYWWSMTVPHGETFSDDVATYLPWLGDKLFGGKYHFMEALPGEGEGATLYVIAGEDLGNANVYEVRNLCKGTAKALLLYYPPGFRLSVSEYLDKFAAPRQLFVETNNSPLQMRYHEGGLFEFILNVADEFGSSVQLRSDTLPIPGFSEVDAQVRHIVQPICQASIRALKFLRQRVEQKIEPQSKA